MYEIDRHLLEIRIFYNILIALIDLGVIVYFLVLYKNNKDKTNFLGVFLGVLVIILVIFVIYIELEIYGGLLK